MALTLEIVTPEARVYSDTIDTVVIPTTEGEIGILPGHIPLLTRVESGELRVTKGGQVSWLAVGAGFSVAFCVPSDEIGVCLEGAMNIIEAKLTPPAFNDAVRYTRSIEDCFAALDAAAMVQP